MTIEQIAEVCHETNRAYCEVLGDYSQQDWENAEDWQRTSAINGVKFELGAPASVPSRSHDEWLKEKKETGWKYGPVKDAEKKEHPCFVPFEQLPAEQQAKDVLFAAVVNSLRQLVK